MLGQYMDVELNRDDAYEMLANRVEHWTNDPIERELFNCMYDKYLYEYGVFDGAKFNVNEIVDNDYINYCSVERKGSDRYDAALAAYNEDSDEFEGGTIEYELPLDNGDYAFLVRLY